MSAALQAIRRTVTAEWPKSSERNAKAFLLRVARSGHQRIMADANQKGLMPDWEAYANTPGNKNLASVILPGPIVYRYRYVTDVVQVILDELRKNSPVQSGDYVRSHTVYVNDAPVDVLPRRLNPTDTIVIANPIVYARRIEVGVTKDGRPFVIQVPNRIYERVAKKNAGVARFKRTLKIRFGYVNISGAYRVKGKLPSHYTNNKGRRTKRRQVVGSAVMAPAIFIEPIDRFK